MRTYYTKTDMKITKCSISSLIGFLVTPGRFIRKGQTRFCSRLQKQISLFSRMFKSTQIPSPYLGPFPGANIAG